MKDVGPADEETTVLEHHYLSQRGFLEENEILDSVQVLKDIPIEIIHGRYDFVCPIEQAYELSSALPNATLTITPSGHASAEPSLEFELRNAAKAMLKKLA